MAADTLELAERAVDAVEVGYEELESVFDVEEALGSSSSPRVVIRHPGEEAQPPNVGRYIRVRQGDVQDAFRKASLTVENTYHTALETHFQLEPLSFLAQPDPDGGLTIWGTSSGPHKMQVELSRYLGIDQRMIRAKVPFLGGWFGSKDENHIASVCAKLALKTGRAVKLELSREECVSASGVRHPAKITIKDGIDESGRIVARYIRAIYDGGAFGAMGNQTLGNAVLTAQCVYDIRDLSMDVYRVYTNHVPGTPKRSPMVVQMAWAVECQMDAIASRLGIEPVEFRQRHLLRNGQTNAVGELMDGICYERCLLEVARRINHERKESEVSGGKRISPWKRGWGIAVTGKYATSGVFQGSVSLTGDGKVEVRADLVENGQGIFTGIAQLIATEFGIPITDVIILPFASGASDSTTSGISRGASGSTQLVDVGGALLQACDEVKRKVAERASDLLGVNPEEVEVSGGFARVKEDALRKSIPISSLFTKANMFGHLNTFMFDQSGGFVGNGTVFLKTGKFDPMTGVAVGGRMSAYYVSAAQAVEVAVNTETGRVRVEQVVAASDVGTAVNPELVRGQIVGSVAMGVSAALFEELVLSNGRIENSSLADYKVMTSSDAIGDVSVIMLEDEKYEHGPYGAKSVGEASIVPTAPAIRNAIHDAIGVWINDLPMTPERVLEALEKKRQNEQGI